MKSLVYIPFKYIMVMIVVSAKRQQACPETWTLKTTQMTIESNIIGDFVKSRFWQICHFDRGEKSNILMLYNEDLLPSFEMTC